MGGGKCYLDLSLHIYNICLDNNLIEMSRNGTT
jgi:hypothetical protein